MVSDRSLARRHDVAPNQATGVGTVLTNWKPRELGGIAVAIERLNERPDETRGGTAGKCPLPGGSSWIVLGGGEDPPHP